LYDNQKENKTTTWAIKLKPTGEEIFAFLALEETETIEQRLEALENEGAITLPLGFFELLEVGEMEESERDE
jgi:hypothetical protein